DTELFGHWWHEGPAFLDAVLRALPQAGVRVTTLRGALQTGAVAGRIELPAGSWGSGKDWRVWDGEQVTDLADENRRVQKRLLDVASAEVRPRTPRRADLDQLAREVLLATASDWAFMVTKDTAAEYARRRAATHIANAYRLASAIETGRAADVAASLRSIDGPFGHLDARNLTRETGSLWHDAA